MICINFFQKVKVHELCSNIYANYRGQIESSSYALFAFEMLRLMEDCFNLKKLLKKLFSKSLQTVYFFPTA